MKRYFLYGIHWMKPKLGLVEKDGSKENNVLITGIPHLITILYSLKFDE